MKVLALELSTSCGSLSLLGEDAKVTRHWPNDRKNSGPLFQQLSDIQKQFTALDVIMVGLGPGSYAGTRIAISTAIGLQVATGARLVGLPSISAMECAEPEYFVIGDARRQTFFFARIRNRDLVEGPTLMSEFELREKLNGAGDHVPVLASEKLAQFGPEIKYPSARILASLARDSNRGFISSPLEPMYLREPHITLPKPITS